jgi:tetratricopeptide (TPR) repeat protein
MCVAGHLVELAAMLEDEQSAAPLYEMFLPYRGQVVAGMVACCLGSVDRHLGMAASVLGRWEEAEAHFEAALLVDTGMRSPPLLARTRYWYARMLATRAGGDRQRATALADKAQATARELGMALLADRTDDLLDRLSLPVNARSTPDS